MDSTEREEIVNCSKLGSGERVFEVKIDGDSAVLVTRFNTVGSGSDGRNITLNKYGKKWKVAKIENYIDCSFEK